MCQIFPTQTWGFSKGNVGQMSYSWLGDVSKTYQRAPCMTCDVSAIRCKHCQRHNGPEGWVLLTKVTPLGHITSSNTNLNQTSSESRPCINFKISTKHHHFDKTKPESRPTMNLIAKTKHQQQNNNQTSASKSCRNINFKILNKPWNLVLKVRTKT